MYFCKYKKSENYKQNIVLQKLIPLSGINDFIFGIPF